MSWFGRGQEEQKRVVVEAVLKDVHEDAESENWNEGLEVALKKRMKKGGLSDRHFKTTTDTENYVYVSWNNVISDGEAQVRNKLEKLGCTFDSAVSSPDEDGYVYLKVLKISPMK